MRRGREHRVEQKTLKFFVASLAETPGLKGTEARSPSTTTILPPMRRSFLAAQGTDFGQKLRLCSSNSDAPSSLWHQATHSHIPEPPEGNCLGPTPRSKALGAITISEACLGCVTQQEENPNSGGANQPGSPYEYSCAGDPRPSRRVQQGLGQLLEHNGDRGGFPTAPAPEGFGCRNIFPPLLLNERREKFGAVWFGSAAFSCFSTSCSALEFEQQGTHCWLSPPVTDLADFSAKSQALLRP